jgi:hypothetical protein
VIGCSGPRASDGDEEVILRVSAVAGLSELSPGLEISGSSAAAVDLVYDHVSLHIESMRAQGASIILFRRASSRYSAEELAAAFTSTDLVSARALDANRIEARFSSDKSASLVAQYAAAGFNLGPFEVESQDEKHIRLVRRGEGAIDVIEVLASTRSDEWRKLLAHELDVVPLAASLYRSQFSGVRSIQILDIPPHDTAALYFNARSSELSDSAVRRAIASSIRRPPIARLVCGDATCASSDLSAGAHLRLPSRLALMVPENFTTFLSAARIVRHQLWPLGVEVSIDPMPVNDIVKRMTAGEFDLVMLPLTKDEDQYGFFLSPGHPKALPMTGFTSAEYDSAVNGGDLKAAQAILDREVPVSRLFELRSFAAVDGAFCGSVTPSASSWRWLADLHPCEEGPPP